MEKIYIFGHKNPDTDSVTSAIALSYLKNELGLNTEPRVLGEINDETKFVLNHFKIEEPEYLNAVKLQIKDLDYYKDFFINENASIEETYDMMDVMRVTGIPLVNNDLKVTGIITNKKILRHLFDVKNNHVLTSFENVLKTLDGTTILKFDDEIKGNVIAATYKSTTFLETVELKHSDILIVGDRHSLIEAAVNSKIKLLILTGNGNIKDEHIEIAKKNKVNIIKTPLDSFRTIKKISLSNYIKNISDLKSSELLYETDYYDEFIKRAQEVGFNNYPVMRENGTCIGMVRITDISKKHRKKVILVDHNESEQSVIGLNEAEILEVIDHHKIGDISTNSPINFRNMTVGSTNTIIYYLFNENRVEIPNKIAGIMLAGILSDTLNLTSPTTTTHDKEVVEKLSKIAKINVDDFAKKMFKSSLSLNNKNEFELINIDIKKFQNKDYNFKVSQIITMDTEDLINRKECFIEELERIRTIDDDKFILLVITDIEKNGSYFIYTNDAKETLEKAFKTNIYQGVFINDFVSRKKQIVPAILESE